MSILRQFAIQIHKVNQCLFHITETHCRHMHYTQLKKREQHHQQCWNEYFLYTRIECNAHLGNYFEAFALNANCE